MQAPNLSIRGGLIRYFILLAVLSFSGYVYTAGAPIFIIILGPVIHVASFILSRIGSGLELTSRQVDYIVLLPLAVIYFGLMGFLLKQLFKENGWLKLVSILGLIGFVAYIHHRSWQNISGYLTPIIFST